MRGRLLAALALAVAPAGCLPAPEHRCAGDTDCAGGVCVSPPSACAFADPACAGGLRFGDGAGALAGTCLSEPIDAAVIDARPPVDARPPIDAPPPPDEDGDGVPDGMDNCPHVDNPLQEDTGEMGLGMPDGVGDACDPEPARLGNQLVLFDGFGGDLSRWMDGGATASGGKLLLGTLDQLTSAQSYPRYVAVTVHGRGTAMAQIGPSLGAAIQGNGNGITCVVTSGGNPRLRVQNNGTTVAETSAIALLGGVEFTLTLTTGRNNWTCVLAVTGHQPITARRASLSTLNPGAVTLTNPVGAPFSLDYVAVISVTDG